MKFITPDWPAPDNVRAHITLRTSWGGRMDDTDEHLVSLLNLPNNPVWFKQVHGDVALEATPSNQEKKADAGFTNKANQVCAILTADCLPVFICNKQGTHVAVAHAGWRGLNLGVIENTVNALHQNPNDLLIWLGPAIGPTQFEVGKDVYEAFTQQHAESASAFIQQSSAEKWLANLYTLAKIRLEHLGIPETQVFGGNYCTFTQDDLFFSYRREKGHRGRMASVIWFHNK